MSKHTVTVADLAGFESEVVLASSVTPTVHKKLTVEIYVTVAVGPVAHFAVYDNETNRKDTFEVLQYAVQRYNEIG